MTSDFLDSGQDEGAISAREEAFERGRRTLGLFAGPLLFFVFLALPMGGLPEAPHRLAAILILCVTFWITEAIPLPATALLGPSLAVLLGVAPAKDTFAPFGDPLLFLFFGSFIIAAAMAHHGLDRRLAYFILSRRRVGRSPAAILVAFGLLSAGISMWISNTATAAMMLPVALGVLSVLSARPVAGSETDPSRGLDDTEGVWTSSGSQARGAPGPGSLDSIGQARKSGPSPYATALMLVVSFGASVGGIGTPVGTPPNLIGIGMIDRLAGRHISFFEWTTFAVPTLLVTLPMMLGMLLILHPVGRGGRWTKSGRVSRVRSLETEAYFRAVHRRLGRWSRGEVAVAACFLLAVGLWVLPGMVALVLGVEAPAARLLADRLPEGPVALVAAAMLFLIPIDWNRKRFACDWRLAARIDWGTVMLFGGGMALGSLMFSSGLARTIGEGVLGTRGAWTLGAYTAVAILAAIVVSEATSNTASASMVVPVVIAIARQQGLDPVLPAVGACLGSSFGFALPVSTAPNALAYGTGFVPILRMLRAGLLLDLIGWITIWGVLMLIGPRG